MKSLLAFALSSIVGLLFASSAKIQAQTNPTVSFTVSPSVFAQGQTTSALICMSPLNTAGTLGFDPNDFIGYILDSSLGTVSSVDNPISVRSSTLLPSDFTVKLGVGNHNKIVI